MKKVMSLLSSPMYELVRAQFIPRPPAEVFAFFERPENLTRLTPPSLRFKLLTPSPVPMKPGSIIDYSIRPFGWPLRWTSVISEYDPPRVFVDVQLRGPYSFWHHTHAFEAAPGGTRVTDHVRYMLPGGVLGRLMAWGRVRRDLEKIFDHRAQALARHFEKGDA